MARQVRWCSVADPTCLRAKNLICSPSLSASTGWLIASRDWWRFAIPPSPNAKWRLCCSTSHRIAAQQALRRTSVFSSHSSIRSLRCAMRVTALIFRRLMLSSVTPFLTGMPSNLGPRQMCTSACRWTPTSELNRGLLRLRRSGVQHPARNGLTVSTFSCSANPSAMSWSVFSRQWVTRVTPCACSLRVVLRRPMPFPTSIVGCAMTLVRMRCCTLAPTVLLNLCPVSRWGSLVSAGPID